MLLWQASSCLLDRGLCRGSRARDQGIWTGLALQLLFLRLVSFQMRPPSRGLVSTSPERPGDDVG